MTTIFIHWISIPKSRQTHDLVECLVVHLEQIEARNQVARCSFRNWASDSHFLHGSPGTRPHPTWGSLWGSSWGLSQPPLWLQLLCPSPPRLPSPHSSGRVAPCLLSLPLGFQPAANQFIVVEWIHEWKLEWTNSCQTSNRWKSTQRCINSKQFA